MQKSQYAPLDTHRIGAYLQTLPQVVQALGPETAHWHVREVGDGNRNLVFVVQGQAGAVVVKQALPYVRLVGESWPLPLQRSYFESNALRIQDRFAPGLTPRVFHTDDAMALIVMEYLSPHIILRKGLIQRKIYPKAATAIAEFMALTLYNTSMLAATAEDHKARIGLFAANTALCKITEDLVFTDPYREAPLNRWTRPHLDPLKAAFEKDARLKLAAQEKKWQFLTEAQALIHGDLHTGSVMVTEEDTRVIDPEFAFVGPMAFDVGAVIANFLLSFFAHRGQQLAGGDDSYCIWLLQQVADVWNHFEQRFLALWEQQPAGEAYGQGLFDDPAGAAARAGHRRVFMRRLLEDSLGFAGCKMIRRILGLAHVEDLESIKDPAVRARGEVLALHFARTLLLNARSFATIADVTGAAHEHAKARP